MSDDTTMGAAPEPRDPVGPQSAGDTLGGAAAPTGNDGTAGDDAPTGDASLANPDLGAAALPNAGDTPSDVFTEDAAEGASPSAEDEVLAAMPDEAAAVEDDDDYDATSLDGDLRNAEDGGADLPDRVEEDDLPDDFPLNQNLPLL